MKSTMKQSFSKVPTISAPRSSFDRSCGHKTTFNSGDVIPIFLDEALPGDTFNLRTSGFARMATPLAPVMDNAFLDTFWFSVPIRQVWSNWRKFCGEQVNPGDSTDYTIPTKLTSAIEGNLFDYFGLPKVANLEVSALPLRAYWHIWNEWFRDQNLQDSAVLHLTDTNDVLIGQPVDARQGGLGEENLPFVRGKRHDYFTSCLPWPQKGDPVTLPLGLRAPITGLAGLSAPTQSPTAISNIDETENNTTTWPYGYIANPGPVTTGDGALFWETNSSGEPLIYADLTNATAATINDLREAFQIQRMLERDSRGGTRYPEIVASHFGVNFQDVTYRPEYLGGGSTAVNINPVPNTAASLGSVGAFGTASFSGHGFVKSFTEHCYVIGLANVRTDLNYFQGVNRLWTRSTRYDFYWPSLAQLGEQAVLNKELYADGSANDDLVFGYQERYAEMRYKPSIITNQFKPTVLAPLDYWHFAEEFTSLPTLSADFIMDNSETVVDRVLTVPGEDQWIADLWFDFKCARPMPLYGTPGLIDHF